MSIDWNEVRAQFPVLTDWVYLNAATFGPVPECAIEAARSHFDRRNRNACGDFLDWYERADGVRRQAARLVNTEPDDIAFIPNAGTALGWLLSGLEWRPGDHVVTLSFEFPDNAYFPHALAGRGVEFSKVPLPDGEFSLERLFDLVTDRTRLVLMSAVNYSSGLRPPLEQIGAELKRRGVLFCVDGTQNVGALPVDVARSEIDFLFVHGYKWLLCPTGIGFACVGPELREQLAPTVYSWRSHRDWRNVDDLNAGAPNPPSSAERYEGGMQNFSGVFAMGAVLEWLERIGADEIERRVDRLADYARGMLRERGGELIHDRHAYYDSPIIAARFADADVSELAVKLRDRRIVVSARKGNLRVSPHFYNNEADLDRLGQALDEPAPAPRRKN